MIGPHIIYLDFETYVNGIHIKTAEIEPVVRPDELAIAFVFDYEPYQFVERCLDTTQFRYTQVINHCKAQYEHIGIVQAL